MLDQEDVVIKRALITHHHHDHVGGIPDLKKISAGTKVYKYQPEDDQEAINDGDVFTVEGATLKALYTPGHTNDHVSFMLEEENAIFTGDNVLGHGTTVFSDLADYMNSLNKMLEQKPGRAYPAHGQLIEDGIAKLKEYIKHRERREQQVVFFLQKFREEEEGPEGAVTSMQLVKRIYTDVDPALHLAAEGSVIQVLEKLEKEGRVASFEDDYGTKKWYLKEDSKSAL